MRLSDDEESFKEAARSLIFNNPPSDPDSLQRAGSSGSSIAPQDSESEVICFDNPPSDPNMIILEVRRMPVGSGSSSMPHQEKSEYT